MSRPRALLKVFEPKVFEVAEDEPCIQCKKFTFLRCIRCYQPVCAKDSKEGECQVPEGWIGR